MTPSYKYIDTTEALIDFCDQSTPGLTAGDFLTLDTEFIRERTYEPQLCLIQAATKDQAVIIDPLAPGMDLTPLLLLLADDSIVKVLHAARQDLEIFLLLMNEIPKNIIDTQVAAMVCGFGESAGYETLVKKITKGVLDKSVRYSNWAQRPLHKSQLDYAIGDVTHLREIYTHLMGVLDEKGRRHWIEEEMADLLNPVTYKPDPVRLMFKLKLRSGKPHILARALALVKWRESEAQARNKPRQNIIRDELIVELATLPPTKATDFKTVRGLRDRPLDEKMIPGILTLLEEASALPVDACPKLPTSSNEASVESLSQDLLRVLLGYICTKEEVAEKVLASSKDLFALARYGEKAEVPCLTGWRREVFGTIALDLLTGKIALAIQDGKLVLRTSF